MMNRFFKHKRKKGVPKMINPPPPPPKPRTKPILVVRIPENLGRNYAIEIEGNLRCRLREDYHVIASITKREEVEFEILNHKHTMNMEGNFNLKDGDLVANITSSEDRKSGLPKYEGPKMPPKPGRIKIWFNPKKKWYEAFSPDGKPMVACQITIADSFPDQSYPTAVINAPVEIVNEMPEEVIEEVTKCGKPI